MSAAKAIYLVWLVWGASWLLAALWADRASARPGFGAELGYRIITVIGAYLLFAATPDNLRGFSEWGYQHGVIHAGAVWRAPSGLRWALFCVTVVGFGFCWWARLHLGRLWSGNVTRKADHRVVDTGPYGLVRHPIYTGVLLSALALAVLKANAPAFIGFVGLTAGFWMKARLEERFLRQQLGVAAYDAYARTTPMLVPFVSRR